MFKSIGTVAATVVKRADLAHVIDDALGWARWEIQHGAAAEPGQPQRVIEACGRLQMARFCGANRNYRPADDEALLRDYLQLRVNA